MNRKPSASEIVLKSYTVDLQTKTSIFVSLHNGVEYTTVYDEQDEPVNATAEGSIEREIEQHIMDLIGDYCLGGMAIGYDL